MKRESIRERKRSFFAVVISMLIVFNLLPLGAFAGTRYYFCNNETDNQYDYINADNRIPQDGTNKLLAPGDEVVLCYSSGSVWIDQKSKEYYTSPFEINPNFDDEYISTYMVQDSNGTKLYTQVGWGYKYVIGSDKNESEAGKYYRAYDGDWGCLILTTEPLGNNNPNSNKSTANESDPNHTHSYTWKISKEPTATSDGEEIYVCECGHIAQINILPGSAAFEADIIAKIKKAPVNGIVTIETRIWNSLSKDVRDALVERPDVTLKISFLSEGYKGIPLKVTIPTGIDRYALWDEKGWLGLCRAGSTLGYDQ